MKQNDLINKMMDIRRNYHPAEHFQMHRLIDVLWVRASTADALMQKAVEALELLEPDEVAVDMDEWRRRDNIKKQVLAELKAAMEEK